ncbi:hypothetical protein HQ520_07755, partial [bacterium]|nr:hypothetical protein [bacterium]
MANPTATLENEHVRLEFIPIERAGKQTFAPRISQRVGDDWRQVPLDPNVEAYTVVQAENVQLDFPGFWPVWKSPGGSSRAPRYAIWEAGNAFSFFPESVRESSNGDLRLTFPSDQIGELRATWSLRPDERNFRVRLEFTPSRPADYSLGYHIFQRRPIEEVSELLLPFQWQRLRLPEESYTLFDTFTPTPVALMQTGKDAEAHTWGVIGDPEEIPFDWPSQKTPHFGLLIRSAEGQVQPAIYGPVPGSDAARCESGQTLSFQFRVFALEGNWYDGFRLAADEVFGLRDYRENTRVSLTEAALNMIDLLMDDEHGGWWEWAKGWYQIESRNGVSNSTPLSVLGLYRLTGDEEVYRRRALPTMAYALSRSNPHFSPIPQDTGRYNKGSMNGPIEQYGTTTYGGFWEMTRRYTDAYRNIAFPEEGVKKTKPYSSHWQAFDEWLGRYNLTGEAEALEKARDLADRYLEEEVYTPPREDLGAKPFFLIQFLPDWEGLLHLYEATGEKRYLDGAVFGARQLMTGLWTQPALPEGPVTIHPGDNFESHIPGIQMRKGDTCFRLGYEQDGPNPRFGQRVVPIQEHEVEPWIVSNIGLGFEQPTTMI